MKINRSLKIFLENFGLNEKEIQIYITLLKNGPSTIMDLSRDTNIKRSTTHNNVEDLINKGLVSQTSYGERRLVIAEDPGKLNFLLEQRKWDLQKMETGLPSIIESIKEMVPQNIRDKSTPIVKYYEGQKAFKEVCQRSLDYAKDEIFFISDLDEWYKIYTEEYDTKHYVPTRIKKNIFLKMLVFESPKTKNMQKVDKNLMRQTQFLPKHFPFKSTIIIYNNEISMMLSSEPYNAIVISNIEIYRTFYALFNSLWKN